MGENRASALYYPGAIFDVNKILGQAQKHHAQLKDEKKISCPRKLPALTLPPPPPSKTKKMVCLLLEEPIDTI